MKMKSEKSLLTFMNVMVEPTNASSFHCENQETWKQKPADPNPSKVVAMMGVSILKTSKGWNARNHSSEGSRRRVLAIS
jgi:hypothetical protein